jgi:hypothetical protein
VGSRNRRRDQDGPAKRRPEGRRSAVGQPKSFAATFATRSP